MEAMPPEAAAPMPVPVAGIVVVGLYVAAQMLADVASLKIALLAGFSIDAGTFVYPLTFTLRDLVHKRLGLAAARTVVLLAAAVNLFMALFFQFAVRLPEDPAWGLGREFAAILGPVWRIVTASIVAEVVSEFLDTEIYRWWVARVTPRFQWMRVLVSNSLSIPLDSLIFCWGAFGGTLPAAVVWSIVFANVIVKGLVTLASLPGIYLVKEPLAERRSP
jgi:hypothetical protein